jgi:enoyl-CoA hydratase
VDVESVTAPRVLGERLGAIHVIKLNRPEKLNAADLELQRQFMAAVEALVDDIEVRALVITGQGRGFCSGGDRSLAVAAGEGRLPHKEELHEIQVRTIRAMLSVPMPVIAAVNGPAVGYGASLVALCDLAVIGEDGFLSDPHVQYGIPASPPTALMWPKLTSHVISRDILLSGRRVGAEEALRIGLVNRVCPAGRELEAALEMARPYLDLPRQGVAATKRALNRAVLDEAAALRFD